MGTLTFLGAQVFFPTRFWAVLGPFVGPAPFFFNPFFLSYSTHFIGGGFFLLFNWLVSHSLVPYKPGNIIRRLRLLNRRGTPHKWAHGFFCGIILWGTPFLKIPGAKIFCRKNPSLCFYHGGHPPKPFLGATKTQYGALSSVRNPAFFVLHIQGGTPLIKNHTPATHLPKWRGSNPRNPPPPENPCVLEALPHPTKDAAHHTPKSGRHQSREHTSFVGAGKPRRHLRFCTETTTNT